MGNLRNFIRGGENFKTLGRVDVLTAMIKINFELKEFSRAICTLFLRIQIIYINSVRNK